MKPIIGILLLHLAFVSVSGHCSADQLKVDSRTNPLGFDNPVPELSWIILSEERGTSQHAYEIMVSDDPGKLESGKGNIWQSGRVETSQTFGIRYSGKPLVSFTRYYWKVRIWDQQGTASEWSHPAWFETAMMNTSDWKAKWITDQRPLPQKDEDFYKETPNPLLRKDIADKKGGEISPVIHSRTWLFNCLHKWSAYFRPYAGYALDTICKAGNVQYIRCYTLAA